MFMITFLGTLLYALDVVELKLDFDNLASIDNVDNLVQYEFQYNVDAGPRHGPVMDRWERRLGEYVKGSYSILQPDGTVRTVDYEVDGDRGYRAITRFTPPPSEYLSLQQLQQSDEMFPRAAPPTLSLDLSPEKTPQTDSTNKIINYHAKPPYINKREYKDHKASASMNIATTAQREAAPKRPLTPANFNVPQTQNLIYYKVPAGKITPNTKLPQTTFDIDSILPSQKPPAKVTYTTGVTGVIHKQKDFPSRNAILDSGTKPIKRNSRLVRRFSSFDEVFL